jgi:hypothetical protein
VSLEDGLRRSIAYIREHVVTEERVLMA